LQIREENWSCCDIPRQILPALDFKKEKIYFKKLLLFSSLASPIGMLSNRTGNKTIIIIIKNSCTDTIDFFPKTLFLKIKSFKKFGRCLFPPLPPYPY